MKIQVEADANDIITDMELEDVILILVKEYTPFTDTRDILDIVDEITKVLEG